MIRDFAPAECATLAAMSATFQQVMDAALSSELSNTVTKPDHTSVAAKKPNGKGKGGKKQSSVDEPKTKTSAADQSATVTTKAKGTKPDTAETASTLTAENLQSPVVASVTEPPAPTPVAAAPVTETVTPVTHDDSVSAIEPIAEITPTKPLQIAAEKDAIYAVPGIDVMQPTNLQTTPIQSATTAPLLSASAKPFQPAAATAIAGPRPMMSHPRAPSVQAPHSVFFSTPVVSPPRQGNSTLICPNTLTLYPALLRQTTSARQFHLEFLPSEGENFIHTDSTLYLKHPTLQAGYALVFVEETSNNFYICQKGQPFLADSIAPQIFNRATNQWVDYYSVVKTTAAVFKDSLTPREAESRQSLVQLNFHSNRSTGAVEYSILCIMLSIVMPATESKHLFSTLSA
jgi:hypothetical protein